ncbi:MAG: preprotein translocase subunit YajC [Defluviitaleaceae bacterium]|nr:preprotein translocase subunit YajC [Defluviitaleaceae bacterium]
MNDFGFTILLTAATENPIIGADDTTNQQTTAGTAAPGATADPNAAASPGSSLFSPFMILIYVVIIGAMYFITIRPQRKRDKQMKEMQSSIKVGDSVLTSSGLFGRIVGMGEDCFIIEFGTNKGIHIPIRKADVLGVKEPKMTAAAADGGKDS